MSNNQKSDRTAIIIGGGPAGLTTALELLRRTDIKPIVYEGADNVGGIARTYQHNGNRLDIGGPSLLFQIRPDHGLVVEDPPPARPRGRQR